MVRRQVQNGGQLVVCCGGYRSGSTLQYNLTGEYVERLRAGHRIGVSHPPTAAALESHWSIVDALGLAVAKTHYIEPIYRDWDGAESVWDRLLGQRRLCLLYSVRDWRDTAASMARFFGLSLAELFESREWQENVRNLDGWLERRPLVQRYETLHRDPEAALRAIAGQLGLPWDAGAATDAIAAASVPAVSAATANLDDLTWDPRTLVHADHLGEPEGGGWRSWTHDEHALARVHLDGLMAAFGYRWAEPAEPAEPAVPSQRARFPRSAQRR